MAARAPVSLHGSDGVSELGHVGSRDVRLFWLGDHASKGEDIITFGGRNLKRDKSRT
jgi:hypothetical protein